MNLASYLGLLCAAEHALADSLRQVSDAHPAEADVHFLCKTLAGQSEQHLVAIAPFVDSYNERYGDSHDDLPAEPARRHRADRLPVAGFGGGREGPIELLRDLQDLYMLANFVDVTWTVIGQAGRAARDLDLVGVVASCESDTAMLVSWLHTRLKQAAPQALVA